LESARIVVDEVRKSIFIIWIGGANDKTSYLPGLDRSNLVGKLKSDFDKEINFDNNARYISKYYGYEDTSNGIILRDIKNQLAKTPALGVNIVGHSLGGGSRLAEMTREFPVKPSMVITLDPVGTTAVSVDNLIFSPTSVFADTWINILAAPETNSFNDLVAMIGGRWIMVQGPSAFFVAPFHHEEVSKLFNYSPGIAQPSAHDILLHKIRSELGSP
jgi:hypothetical protein